MLGNPTTTTSTSTSGGNPTYPSTDPNQNSIPTDNTFNNGPSVYLYGFLATLVLIFLVSIGVAWKGYRTRRVLRARIDEAIARGVLIPGYDPSDPNLPLFPPTAFGPRSRNAQALVRPVLYEEWIADKGDVEEGEGKWDIKPTALDVLRPYDPTPLTTTAHHPSSHANSLFSHLLDPLRQYWFVQPPEGVDADQLQGRPGRGGGGRDRRDRRRRGGQSTTEALNRLEEEQVEKRKLEESMGVLGANQVVASVFIAMPDRGHPAWGVRSRGVVNGGHGGRVGPGVASGSTASSWQQQLLLQGVASGSRPISSNAAPAYPHGAGSTASHGGSSLISHGASSSIGTAAVLEGERKELPELVLGVVSLGLREEERVAAVEEQEEEGLGIPMGNTGGEKRKEPAATSPL